MPKPFPAEFRRDVIAVARKGEASIARLAQGFGISLSDVWYNSPSAAPPTHRN